MAEYIKTHNLTLPAQGSGYDHTESALGSIYSMPGGLKENVEFMLGKGLRIDKSEGTSVVYDALDAFGQADAADLPAIFDVLNCPEGCNLGTGCNHNKSFFEVNSSMAQARSDAVDGRDSDYFEEMYRKFDETLRLEHFVRRYYAKPARSIPVDEAAIEEAFTQLGKHDQTARNFNCGACGSDTCEAMAVKIAKKVNTAENCIQKAHTDMHDKHTAVLNWQTQNAGAIQSIQQDISDIKNISDKIVGNVSSVDEMINVYETMAKDIDKIASNIHMISLNASIEAARAGEHGKSFAVVAEAIRALANDTQSATSKIAKASADAKTALGNISDMVVSIGAAISQSHDNVSEIAANTQEMLQE